MSGLIPELRTASILLLISISIFLLDNLSILSLPKTLASQTFAPIQYGIYQTGLKFSYNLKLLTSLKTSGQQLQALNSQLSSLLVENSDLRRQLADTKAQLVQEQTLNPATYNMIASTPIGISRYLILSLGSKDNLAPGMPVVYKDTLLGTLKEVSFNRSNVILASDPDSKIAVFTQQGSDKTKGVLIGQFGQEMLLDKILHQEKISPGDLVYSAGLDSNIPKGLILGVVSEVLSADNQVFKQAKVRPIFNPLDLDTVFVITN